MRGLQRRKWRFTRSIELSPSEWRSGRSRSEPFFGPDAGTVLIWLIGFVASMVFWRAFY